MCESVYEEPGQNCRDRYIDLIRTWINGPAPTQHENVPISFLSSPLFGYKETISCASSDFSVPFKGRTCMVIHDLMIYDHNCCRRVTEGKNKLKIASLALSPLDE